MICLGQQNHGCIAVDGSHGVCVKDSISGVLVKAGAKECLLSMDF